MEFIGCYTVNLKLNVPSTREESLWSQLIYVLDGFISLLRKLTALTSVEEEIVIHTVPCHLLIQILNAYKDTQHMWGYFKFWPWFGTKLKAETRFLWPLLSQFVSKFHEIWHVFSYKLSSKGLYLKCCFLSYSFLHC